MIAFEYLRKGLIGLANAHKAGTMAGHLGAAVAAGYFFGEDQPGLPEGVFRGVEGELDRIVGGEEAIWFNARQAGLSPSDLFRPLPDEPPRPEELGTIAEALGRNAGETRQSGHNVIFASIGLRALKDHPDLASPRVIDGIRRLTMGFDNAHAGRGYYGKDQGWKNGNQVDVPPDPSFPPYESIGQMVDVTIGELIASSGVKKQGFGGLWHVINHAAAIAELGRIGFGDLARQAMPAHHHHVRLWRSLPDVEEELGPVIKAEADPRDPDYWLGMLKRDEARLTHRIKTLYGYHTIRRYVVDPGTVARADDAFLDLMA